MNFESNIDGARVYLQHMTEESAADITKLVQVKANSLIISGELLNSDAAVICVKRHAN